MPLEKTKRKERNAGNKKKGEKKVAEPQRLRRGKRGASKHQQSKLWIDTTTTIFTITTLLLRGKRHGGRSIFALESKEQLAQQFVWRRML